MDRFAHKLKSRLVRANDEQAQGVIEFALIISVLLFLFLGTVDFGRFLYYDDAIRSAARTGGEVAINHCPFRAQCGLFTNVMSQDYVLQATSCEDSPYVKLYPQPSTCQPCSQTDYTSCSSPCTGTCLSNICQQDVCISYSPSATTGSDVTVTVGYAFQPLTFALAPFFNTQACYTGDATTNKHTLCAQSSGRIS